MSLETQIAGAVTEARKVFDLVAGQFGKWDGQVKAQVGKLEDWKNGFLNILRSDEVPVFNLVPNAKLDMVDADGNFKMYGFFWWKSRIASISSERIQINDAGWWKSSRYALRLTLKGDTSDATHYAGLFAGAYGESIVPNGLGYIRTTRAFSYRVISNNGENTVKIGWETGSKPLDMTISNEWKEASIVTNGQQTSSLISFYLEADKEVTIEITNIRINLGNSDRDTLPLNRLASLAVRGEWN